MFVRFVRFVWLAQLFTLIVRVYVSYVSLGFSNMSHIIFHTVHLGGCDAKLFHDDARYEKIHEIHIRLLLQISLMLYRTNLYANSTFIHSKGQMDLFIMIIAMLEKTMSVHDRTQRCARCDWEEKETKNRALGDSCGEALYGLMPVSAIQGSPRMIALVLT